MRKRIFALLCLLCAGCSPKLVYDSEQQLSSEQRQTVIDYQHALLRDFDIDYRVVIVSGPVDALAKTANELYRKHGVGEQSKAGRGALLLVDIGGKQARLETGTGLEAVFPDAFVRYLQTAQMAPFFARDRIAHGVMASTELVAARANDADNAKSWQHTTNNVAAGGGANLASQQIQAHAHSPQGNANCDPPPVDVVNAYHLAMSNHNANPNLDIYRADTQHMFASWVITRGQMDNLVKSFKRCQIHSLRFNPTKTRTVVRYRPKDRACSPYFCCANKASGYST